MFCADVCDSWLCGCAARPSTTACTPTLAVRVARFRAARRCSPVRTAAVSSCTTECARASSTTSRPSSMYAPAAVLHAFPRRTHPPSSTLHMQGTRSLVGDQLLNYYFKYYESFTISMKRVNALFAYLVRSSRSGSPHERESTLALCSHLHPSMSRTATGSRLSATTRTATSTRSIRYVSSHFIASIARN